jgi:hypothetical protein
MSPLYRKPADRAKNISYFPVRWLHIEKMKIYQQHTGSGEKKRKGVCC